MVIFRIMLLWEGDINFNKSAHTCANIHKYIHDNPTHSPQLSCLSRHRTKSNTVKIGKMVAVVAEKSIRLYVKLSIPLNLFFLTRVMAPVSLMAALSL